VVFVNTHRDIRYDRYFSPACRMEENELREEGEEEYGSDLLDKIPRVEFGCVEDVVHIK